MGKYSLHWAVGVIESYAKQKPFAYDFLTLELQYSHTHLVHILAEGDSYWPELRKIANSWANWHGVGRPMLRRGHYIASGECKWRLTFYDLWKNNVSKPVYDRLTDWKNEIGYKSRDQTGLVGEAPSADPTNPNLFCDFWGS